MSETVAENATVAETENDSMEKLQIDEEDEKNASAEDFLGGKSLLMSDSEDDETPIGAGKQISPKKKVKGTKEAEMQIDVPEQAEAMENETEMTRSLHKPKKKISAIIDSESEEEHDAGGTAAMQEEANESSQEKEQEMDKLSKTTSKKKISTIIDSESEEDQPSNKSSKAKPKKKISAIIDSDSEEEQQVQQGKKHSKQKKESKKQSKEKQQRMDSDEENSAQSSDEDSSSGAQKKLKGIVDSESESESSNADEPMDEPEQSNAPTDKSKKSKPMRASAKKALDDMQAIQSEQQRLHREAHISVPYHQPKPRTLKEFLSRRTINKPMELALAGGSPMPSKKEPRKSLALRMNSEELQAYAKLMEERAKEATEFFKSESEHEDDNEEKEGDAEVDEPGVLDAVAEAAEQPAEAASEVDVDGTSTVPEMTAEDAAGTESESIVEPSLEAASPTKTVLVTEVVELPKLDLSTLSITPPSKPATPRISEAIRRLRDEKSSDVSPSLKGDANMVIDLETGDMFAKKPTGVDDLLQRLMKTREAKKHKTTETVNILSTSHGKLEMSKVNIHLHEEEPVNKEQKPGAAYIKMQEHLKSLITKKRMEEMRKKKAEEEEAENEDMDVDEEYEPDEKPCKSQVVVNEDEEIVDEEVNEDADAEEEEAKDGEETVVACAEEAEQEGDEEEDKEELDVEASSSSEEESEPEEEATQTHGKRKNRIIRAFQDDNSDDDDMDLLQTPKQSTVAPLTASQLQLSAQKLFDAEVERTASDEENELLGLCSGRFTQAQSSIAASAGALISQIPITQAPESSQAPEELEALCSGTFETQPAPLPEPATNKIVSSDDEAPKQSEEEERPRQKKLIKKRQKKKAKLGFSDDEEEESSEEEGEEQEKSDTEEAAEEVPETFVDYDSEENEVVVQMTKKDRKLRAANFVEKEAELSESEWGSADEDEKNMDKYDIELGDEEEFDREKLQHELGQIHARKMLDKDIREVRQIQEMLFEDEEGAVRQRQFRWKNAESAGFSLDDTRNANADADANEGSGDEENEHLWRKIRYEREQLLLEKGLKGDATANSPAPLSPAVNNSNVASGGVRKLTIITAKKTTVELKKSSPFLISKSVNAAQKQQAVRGSFLVRDKDTLNKLAGLTKSGAGDVDGTAGTVNVKSVKGKNFVFATLTEEEHESQKRKAADLLNSSSETGMNFIKKPRVEPRREKCLIDQLL